MGNYWSTECMAGRADAGLVDAEDVERQLKHGHGYSGRAFLVKPGPEEEKGLVNWGLLSHPV